MKLESAIRVLTTNTTAALVDLEGVINIRRTVGAEFVYRPVPSRVVKALKSRGFTVVRLPRTYETFGAVGR